MGTFIIEGGKRLQGELTVDGAKNSVLPILASTILNCSESVIHNVPNIKDVHTICTMLTSIGCTCKTDGNTIIIDSKDARNVYIPEKEVREMRSSIILLGAMLSRFKTANIVYPGGCDLGPRPIDMHLNGLKQLGAKIDESHGYIHCECDRLYGKEIHLDYPSVGATENIMLAAVKAIGTTVIQNAAMEPEIVDMQNFLIKMGGRVTGAGSNTIIIEGVSKLYTAEHNIIPDRIVAGTYIAAAAVTGGNLVLNKVNCNDIRPIIAKFTESGCSIKEYDGRLQVKVNKRIKSIDLIKTLPYPGFPTDMQAPMMSVLTLAKGTSVVIETIFESRFKHAEELMKMGANIQIEGRTAVIRGVGKLSGAKVRARDLRGGAALVIAALAAEGNSTVEEIDIHLDRGYEKLDEKLNLLGGNIKRVNNEKGGI